jgi:hypothetical protein
MTATISSTFGGPAGSAARGTTPDYPDEWIVGLPRPSRYRFPPGSSA